jgi:hypothetical protein
MKFKWEFIFEKHTWMHFYERPSGAEVIGAVAGIGGVGTYGAGEAGIGASSAGGITVRASGAGGNCKGGNNIIGDSSGLAL